MYDGVKLTRCWENVLHDITTVQLNVSRIARSSGCTFSVGHPGPGRRSIQFCTSLGTKLFVRMAVLANHQDQHRKSSESNRICPTSPPRFVICFHHMHPPPVHDAHISGAVRCPFSLMPVCVKRGSPSVEVVEQSSVLRLTHTLSSFPSYLP